MPKIGMEPIRREALIQATIAEIGAKGTLDVTVSAIARRAGVSSALAHHYFGGKDQIFLAAMTHILRAYGRELCKALRHCPHPQDRVSAIVRVGFTDKNFSPAVVSAWMNFYALALSSPAAARLLSIYQQRLRSNLRHALRHHMAAPEEAAERLAALIDGLYLRAGLNPDTSDASQVIALALAQIQLELKGTEQ